MSTGPRRNNPSRTGPGGGRPRQRGRFVPRRKVCSFCVEKIRIIDYKDVGRIRRYISDSSR